MGFSLVFRLGLRLLAEDSAEQAGLFGRVNFGLGVFAIAPLTGRHAALDLRNVLTAAGPSGFATDFAGDG